MKTKEQQFEEYQASGGTLDFHGWEASFKYDPSLEYTPEQLRDWMVNNENDYGCYPTEEEWDEILKENASEKNTSCESIEFRILYKQEKREVLFHTVLSLLQDFPKERIEQVLEGQTPEELVDYCKMIYDKEFDLNVDAVGVVGADEIAWHEALGILIDTSDEE